MLVTAAFTAYAFVPSALSAHLLAIFGRTGIDSATVVLIGTLFGPAQVAARVTELAFGRNLHPLLSRARRWRFWCAAFALLALFGISVPLAAAFALMFGAANGLVTIARGALPLALFGADGYGRLMGRISGFWLVMQSAAPLVMAFVAERASDATALAWPRDLPLWRWPASPRSDAAVSVRRSGTCRRCRPEWRGRDHRRSFGPLRKRRSSLRPLRRARPA